jgi:hypothetical protein
MSLLAPALLAGLALLAVPVLVHLTRRHRADVAPFPSLMFLRRIPIRTTKRRRIRHPLLFALRCIAVVLIVLAFTRPYVAGGAEGTSEDMRDVVLLVDVSGSMGYEERRAAAATAAREVLAELGEGDRAALVTFDDRASERVSLTADLAAVDAALGALPASDRPTRIENGLQLAGRILGESDRSAREVVLISDFQRTGWDGTGRTRLPDGVALRMVPVDEGDAPNLAVVDVRFAAGPASARHRLLARVLNLGDTAVTGVEVELELAGRPVAVQAVDVAPREAATVLFDDVPLPAGRPLGRIRITRDGLAADDELRFVATPDPVLDVTLVEGAGGRADRSLYLERALALAEQPRTRLTRRSAVGAVGGAVGDAAGGAVVLNDAVPDAADVERLSEWVAAGGALFVVLGPGATAERWQGRDARLLGGRVGSVVDRAGRGGSRLTAIDYDHPVFEAFSAPRSGDFSTTRFWRFRAFEADSLTTVLARFEDGEPALTEHSIGAGRVLTWASTLDRFWNDLALQPVFLPFVHRVLRHAARWQPPERWLVAGASREAGALAADGDGADRVLVTPGGSRVPIEAGGDEVWIEFDEAGFYRLEPVGGGDPVAEVAVNLPPAESDLAPIAPERIAGEVVGDLVVRNDQAGGSGDAGGAGGVGGPRTAGGVGTGSDGAPGRRELWWPLLALAGVVLGAESWLANRWSWSSTRRRDS